MCIRRLLALFQSQTHRLLQPTKYSKYVYSFQLSNCFLLFECLLAYSMMKLSGRSSQPNTSEGVCSPFDTTGLQSHHPPPQQVTTPTSDCTSTQGSSNSSSRHAIAPAEKQIHYTAGSNLYVASLPPNFTDEDLFSLFSPYGPIISAKAMCKKGLKECKGYGFVLFQREDDALRAQSGMIGHVIGNNKIQVRQARATAAPPVLDSTKTMKPKQVERAVMHPNTEVLQPQRMCDMSGVPPVAMQQVYYPPGLVPFSNAVPQPQPPAPFYQQPQYSTPIQMPYGVQPSSYYVSNQNPPMMATAPAGMPNNQQQYVYVLVTPQQL